MKHNSVLFGIFLIFLVSTPAMAFFPGDWWGKVYIDGAIAPDGTYVSAYVNGELSDESRVGAKLEPGYYELIIMDALIGDNITFKIGSAWAEQSAVFSEGAHSRTDLTVKGSILGNSSLSKVQDTSGSLGTNSPTIFDPLPANNSGTDSVLGKPCNSTWACTLWSECRKDIRNRTCTDINDCTFPTNSPPLSEPCVSEEQNVSYCGEGICGIGEICVQDCGQNSSARKSLNLSSVSAVPTGNFLGMPYGNWMLGVVLLVILLVATLAYKVQSSKNQRYAIRSN